VVKIKKLNCCLENNGVTILTFWGHVTSSVTWPFDSRCETSYGWSIVTMHLSCTVMEIWSLKCWTDGRTNAQVILYSVQCYCIALDRQSMRIHF